MPEDPSNWMAFKELIATPDLPGIGPQVRSSRRKAAELNQLVDRFVSDHPMASGLETCLQSAALLWHDHLEASHEISQTIHTRDGSFLHGIMHRREPDYGNAKYWFNQVGSHPAYSGIGERAGPFLERKKQSSLCCRLLARGVWDPFAFVDACEDAARQPGEMSALLPAIQEIEFECLLEHLFRSQPS